MHCRLQHGVVKLTGGVSACPDDRSRVIHRVTHLLIHRLKLDALFVSLIMGPFAQWVDSAEQIAHEMSADDQAQAHAIIDACG